jgi:hypothetical protein
MKLYNSYIILILLVLLVLVLLVLLIVYRKKIEAFIEYKNNDLRGLWRCNLLYNNNITFKQNDTIIKGYYNSEKEEIIGIISKNTIKMYIVDTKLKLDGQLIKDNRNGLVTTIKLNNGLIFNKVVRKPPRSNILKKLDTPNLSGKWLDTNMRGDFIVIEQFSDIINGYYRDIEFGTGQIVNNKVIFNYNFLNNTNEFNDSLDKKIIGTIIFKNKIPHTINWINGTSWKYIKQ